MDIIGLLKSKTRKDLLTIFFTNPEESYYLRQLVNLFNVSAGSLHREIKKLEDFGILNAQPKGNLILYEVNKNHPLFSEIKSIIFKTVGVEGALREIINNTAGIEFSFIYGSFASGRESSSSDVDLIIIGRINEGEFSKKIGELGDKLQREVNYTYFSQKDWNHYLKIEDSFVANILDKPKIMLKGNEDELR